MKLSVIKVTQGIENNKKTLPEKRAFYYLPKQLLFID